MNEMDNIVDLRNLKPKTKEERLTEIIQHIKRVENNCNILAQKIKETDFDFALKLIKLGRIHDASKFEQFEFDNLTGSSHLFLDALKIHHYNNPHHPEHWSGGIKQMPKIYLAEMVCDCKARGEEFGTSTRLWFHDHATKKYGFKMTDECGIWIENCMNLLMPEPFQNINITYKSEEN